MILADPRSLLQSAARYHERVAPEAAAESRSQQSNRNRYLARNLARTRAVMLAAEADASGAPATPAASVAQLSRERIVGTSDLVDINYMEMAIAISRAVARVQIGNSYGTGFLIGPGLAMTNNHVLPDAASAAGAVFQFDYQDNASGELLPRHDFRADTARFFFTDPVLDFTIVGVQSQAVSRPTLLNCYPWVRLIADTGKAEKGDPVNIVQHPRGGLKQIAFRANYVIEIPDSKRDFLYYSSDTEPGSSGAPCFNDQWELIALHHSGVPETKNGQILRTDGKPWQKGTDPEGLIHWIANEGARVSVIVSTMRAATLKAEWRDLCDQALEGAAPNPVELARRATPGVGNGQPHTVETPGVVTSVGGRGGERSIVVQVTVNLGRDGDVPAAAVTAPGAVVVTPGAARLPEPAEEAITIDPDWAARKGYDPKFLGVQVPIPELTAEQLSVTVAVPPPYRAPGNKYLLRYHHYSVAMHAKRRCAWFSAAMIDGQKLQSFSRPKDKWFYDPRIDQKYQMGEELYSGDNTDRGHLTRFKDLAWGDSMDEAVKSTNDSFHFTNCTLQLSAFNQGKDRWQGLEQFLLEQHAAKEDLRMAVITGPVLKANDPVYRNPAMSYSTRVPLSFWKLCVLRRQSDKSLAVTAFRLGQQDITDLPGFEEKFNVGLAQITVKELEAATGLGFGALAKYDHLAAGGAKGTLEIAEGRAVRIIQELDDVFV